MTSVVVACDEARFEDKIPDELLRVIASHLSNANQASLCATNRHFNSLVRPTTIAARTLCYMKRRERAPFTVYALVRDAPDDRISLDTLDLGVDGWGSMWPILPTDSKQPDVLHHTRTPDLPEWSGTPNEFLDMWCVHTSCVDHGAQFENVLCKCVLDAIHAGVHHLPIHASPSAMARHG